MTQLRYLFLIHLGLVSEDRVSFCQNAALILTIGSLVLTVRHQSYGRNKKVEHDDKKGQKLVDR